MWNWLSNYRVLLVVYGVALIASLNELFSPTTSSDVMPAGFEQVMEELYPELPELSFDRGQQAMQNGDLPAARKYFEQALASGVKTHENMQYMYAITLVLLKAPQSEIENAIARWRRNFPHSNRLDPREAGENRGAFSP